MSERMKWLFCLLLFLLLSALDLFGTSYYVATTGSDANPGTLGFSQIDVSLIGAYNDPLRASWPLDNPGVKSLRIRNLYVR